MENTIGLGVYGSVMDYFEEDEKFDESAKELVIAYEDLCKKAVGAMRRAVSSDEDRKDAICYLSAVKALQAILSRYAVDLPSKNVDFSHLDYFIADISKINLPAIRKSGG